MAYSGSARIRGIQFQKLAGTTMKCNFCGKDIPDDSRNCPFCKIYISRTFRDPPPKKEETPRTDSSTAQNHNSDSSLTRPAATAPENVPARNTAEPASAPEKSPAQANSSDSINIPGGNEGISSGTGTAKPAPEKKAPLSLAKPSRNNSGDSKPLAAFCASCGSPLTPGASFCSVCGASMSGSNAGTEAAKTDSPSRDSMHAPAYSPYGNSASPEKHPGLGNLNTRMDSMAKMVTAEIIISLISAIISISALISLVLYIIILKKSFPLVQDAAKMFAQAGSSWPRWMVYCRKSGTLLKVLSWLLAALFINTAVMLTVLAIKLDSESYSESLESFMIISVLLSMTLMLASIILQIQATVRFFKVRAMLRELEKN